MTFGLWFTVTMAWAPVIGVLSQTLAVRALTPGTREAGRRALRRTVLLAAAFTGVAVAASAAFGDAPPVTFFVAAAAFHTGWWFGARPLLSRDRTAIAAERADAPPPSRRVASLVVRDEEALLPRRFWALPAAVLLVCAAVIGWAGFEGRVSWHDRGWTAALLWGAGLSVLAGWGLWAVAAARAGQDLSSASDPTEADRLCRDFRRFVVRWLFALTTLAVIACGAGAAALAAAGPDAATARIGGWVGGGGGTLIGLLGALFGLLADRRRRAILELGGVPPDVRRREPRAAGQSG